MRAIVLLVLTLCLPALVRAAPPARPGGRPADAGDRDGLQQRYGEALALMARGDCAGAVPLFEGVHARGGFKNALWNLAECYTALGRFSQALSALERYRQHPRITPTERDQAARDIEKLQQRTSRLTVVTRPVGAAISLDGEEVGKGPLTLVVDPGRHSVDVASPSFSAQRQRVQVEPGQLRTLEVALVLLPAQIGITSRPPGAELRVADRPVGRLPLTTEVAPGAVQLEARLPGHRPHRRLVTVGPGDRLQLALELRKQAAVLAVASNLPLAQVVLDGRPLGDAPVSVFDVAPGHHQLQVRRPGYQAWSQPIDLRDGEAARVNVQLVRGRFHPAWFATVVATTLGLLAGGAVLFAQARDQVGSAEQTVDLIRSGGLPASQVRPRQLRAQQMLDASDRRQIAGGVLLGAAGIAAAGAVVLGLFTRWTPSSGRVRIVPAGEAAP